MMYDVASSFCAICLPKKYSFLYNMWYHRAEDIQFQYKVSINETKKVRNKCKINFLNGQMTTYGIWYENNSKNSFLLEWYYNRRCLLKYKKQAFELNYIWHHSSLFHVAIYFLRLLYVWSIKIGLRQLSYRIN